MTLYSITSPARRLYDICRIRPDGVNLLEGAGYDDQDLESLVITNEPGASITALPRTRGIVVELPRTGEHLALALSLETAFADARKFYAGGFSELIPA